MLIIKDLCSSVAHLDSLEAQILEMHRWMLVIEEHITADSLKNRYVGKAGKVNTLLSEFEDQS